MASGDGLIPLREEEEYDRAVTAGIAVLYKHSDRCFACRRSLKQMRRLVEDRPDVPVYIVDVIGQRALSLQIAEKLQVRHESPQAIVLEDGRPVWDGSHFAVTAEALQQELDRLAETD